MYCASPTATVGDVVRDDALEQAEGARPDGLDLPQVREVEQPHALADRAVLGERAAVLDGHAPAGERPELRARGLVLGRAAACP